MKKITYLLAFFMIAVAGSHGYSQNSLTISSISGVVPGNTISVVVQAQITTATSAFQFSINFNPDILQYVSTTGYYPDMVTVGGNPLSASNNTTGTIQYLWSDGGLPPYTGFTIPTTDQFMIINFTCINYASGSSSITFSGNPTAIEFDDCNYPIPNIYNPTLNNGGITTISPPATSNYSGTGNWITIARWDNGLPGSTTAATILNGATAVITTNAHCNTLTINGGGALTLNTSKTLAIGGTFTINSTGSFIDLTGSSKTATVKRDMTGNWTSGNPDQGTIWHAVSSPVSGQSNNIFNGSLMNKWNEVTEYWDALSLPYITMGVGTGYIVAPTNLGITAIFSGTLNTGNQTISGLTKTGALAWSGFNLVGNPFASGIQWNTGIGVSSVANYAWLWNGSAYIAMDRTSIDPVTHNYIPAEQGFFVQASNSGSVTIPSTCRVHTATAYYKDAVSDLLDLKVEGNGYWDLTQVRILPEAGELYNIDFDALKFPGSDAAPQLNSFKQDVALSILSIPTLSVYPVIMLGFKPGTNGNFTITASGLETFGSGTNVYLEDILASKNQDLNANPIYEFNASAGQPEHRFNLHFAALGVSDLNSSNIHIYSNEKTIYVNIPSALNGEIVVYNIMGVEMARKQIVGNSINKINTNLSTGYYIVKVLGDTQSLANKVFIR